MKKFMIFYAGILRILFWVTGKNVSISKGVGIHPLAYVQPGKGRISIGEDTHIMRGAIIMAYDGTVEMGKNCTLNPYAVLYGHGGIFIGDDVRIATQVTVVSFDHIFMEKDRLIRLQGETKEKIVISSDVWIGAGAKVLSGTIIGEGCVVGANAVLKGDTEPYGVYAGIPARKIKSRISGG